MESRLLTGLFCLLWMPFVSGQLGGNYSYSFLNLEHSARSTALGGGAIAIKDHDVSLGLLNPALLNQEMISDVSFNHNFHFADIQHGTVNAGFHLKKPDLMMHGGIQYIDYGDFVRADEFGNKQGEFSAREMALIIGASRRLNERMRAGLNLKLINSRLDIYDSFGLAADLGMIYENPESQVVVAFVVKNIGTQLSKYTTESDPMPLNIQIGFSKRFEHLPFRFSVTAHHLNQWNLLYVNPEEEDPSTVFGEEPGTQGEFSKQIDNFFRHLIFSGEFLIGKTENFKLRFAYNHQRKQELGVSSFRSLGGFSIGFGLKIKKYRFDYGVGYYHLAGAVNHIGLGINLAEFKSKI